MPKPTRTQERISLPGGCYWKKDRGNFGDIYSSTNRLIFCGVVEGEAENLAAALQSPAGECRVEQLVALCIALENAYNGVNGDLPPHLWEQMRTLRKDWNERTAAGSLPPAPTGEAE